MLEICKDCYKCRRSWEGEGGGNGGNAIEDNVLPLNDTVLADIFGIT